MIPMLLRPSHTKSMSTLISTGHLPSKFFVSIEDAVVYTEIDLQVGNIVRPQLYREAADGACKSGIPDLLGDTGCWKDRRQRVIRAGANRTCF